MDLRFGLISADDHVQEPPDLWTARLSRAIWGDRVPRIEAQTDGSECWVVDGRRAPLGGPAELGAALADRAGSPLRWEDVPESYFVPRRRLEAMDRDGVDCSVLYPTAAGVAGETLTAIRDRDLQLACIRAYNDWLVDEWAAFDSRFIAQCLVPLTSVPDAVDEVVRAADKGHRGVVLPAIPSFETGVPHLNDAAWDPFWATCAERALPVCFHAGAPGPIQISPDPRLAPRLAGAFRAITRPASHIPVMVNFLISRILLRHPALRVVFAESALGWVAYLLEFTDHQFREDRVDREGYELNPSGMFHRQCAVTGWYDRAAVRTRQHIGVENIMWSTNFPLTTSTWPNTREFVARAMAEVPEDERRRILWGNAAAIYRL
ncbi:MAG TPA: amidohydrolase family protein [Chloroflexota bacterium]|nr:amidohydrolase family protein [Chloroflexota bacterium]